MTTPILEPLLTVTAPPPPSAPREASAPDRSFRELLAPVCRAPNESAEKPSEAPSDPPSAAPATEAASTTPPDGDKEPQGDGEEEAKTDEATLPDVVALVAPVVKEEAELEPEPTREEAVDVTAAVEEAAPRTSPLHATQTAAEPAEAPQPTEHPVAETATPLVEAQTQAIDEVEVVSDTEPRRESLEVLKTTPTPQESSQETPPEAPPEAAAEATSAPAAADAVDAPPAPTELPAAPETSPRKRATAKADAAVPAREPSAARPAETAEQQPADAAPATDVASTTPVARDVPAEPTRSKAKSPETEKRTVKASAEAVAPQLTPDEGTAPIEAAPSPVVASTVEPVPEPPAAPVEAAATRNENSAAPTVPVTASTERLGAMLAQRRVKTSASGQGQPLTESQQARLVQRVAKAFDTARMRGEDAIRLRLSPPQLGSLKLEVRMESGVMTARLEVETVAAQQALADNLGTLRQRLAEQNIRVEQFDIDLMERQPGNSSDSPNSQFSEQQRRPAQRGATRSADASRAAATGTAHDVRTAAIANSGSLDVLI